MLLFYKETFNCFFDKYHISSIYKFSCKFSFWRPSLQYLLLEECVKESKYSCVGGSIVLFRAIAFSEECWGCLTLCTLYMCYGIRPPRWSNIVNCSIPNKPRWCARFGWTMINYAFYVTTSQSGGGEKGDK